MTTHRQTCQVSDRSPQGFALSARCFSAGRLPDLLAALTRHRAAVYDALLQTQARALLARSDGSPAWAAQWAALHDLWGLPCCGFPTWSTWAQDVARHPTGVNPPNQ
jgi:hypothetical protein